MSLSESVNFEALDISRRSETARLSEKVWGEVAAKLGRLAPKPVLCGSEPSLLETLQEAGFVRLVKGKAGSGVRILKKGEFPK